MHLSLRSAWDFYRFGVDCGLGVFGFVCGFVAIPAGLVLGVGVIKGVLAARRHNPWSLRKPK